MHTKNNTQCKTSKLLPQLREEVSVGRQLRLNHHETGIEEVSVLDPDWLPNLRVVVWNTKWCRCTNFSENLAGGDGEFFEASDAEGQKSDKSG